MVGFDPYHNQKSTKISTRGKVLNYISAKPSTFTEIRKGVKLSKSTLYQHLNELVLADLIRKSLVGDQVVYELTEKGKGRQRVLNEVLSKSFGFFIKLAQNKDAVKTLNDMVESGKEIPEFFPFLENYMQWYADYVSAMWSDDGIKWFNRHGNAASDIMKTEVNKQLAPLLAQRKTK